VPTHRGLARVWSPPTYVLQRALRQWAYAIAPSLIQKRPGVQRKHDKRAASELARRYRARETTAFRIPSETEESVRDVVRYRETFQREILNHATRLWSSSRGAALCSRGHELVYAARQMAAALGDGSRRRSCPRIGWYSASKATFSLMPDA
jgi:hypothetical protein